MSRNKGFTLIELMVVVAIVAILAAIALPSYTKQVQKSRRAQAKADLTELAQMLERKYSVDRTYAGFSIPTAQQNSPRDPGATVAYTVTSPIPNLAARTFTLTAVPLTTGPQNNDLCGTLTLDQTGTKTHSAGDNATCAWGTTATP